MPVELSTQGGGTWDVELLDRGPSPIMVIKYIRETLGCGLAEAKHFTDSTPCVVGAALGLEAAQAFCTALVNAGAGAWLRPSAGPHGEPAPLASGALYEVTLGATGANKILVIKTLREFLGTGLFEAKQLAESAPCSLGRAFDAARAEAFRRALEAAGATARVEPVG